MTEQRAELTEEGEAELEDVFDPATRPACPRGCGEQRVRASTDEKQWAQWVCGACGMAWLTVDARSDVPEDTLLLDALTDAPTQGMRIMGRIVSGPSRDRIVWYADTQESREQGKFIAEGGTPRELVRALLAQQPAAPGHEETLADDIGDPVGEAACQEHEELKRRAAICAVCQEPVANRPFCAAECERLRVPAAPSHEATPLADSPQCRTFEVPLNQRSCEVPGDCRGWREWARQYERSDER